MLMQFQIFHYICRPQIPKYYYPDVVKLVDTSDLGSDAVRCGGSSPSIRTNWDKCSYLQFVPFLFLINKYNLIIRVS
jgi:hypothetical protein